jgi:hypothetical protein
MEAKANKLNGLGLLAAFVISILSLALVGLSIFLSKPTASIAPSIIAIGSLAAIFTSRTK